MNTSALNKNDGLTARSQQSVNKDGKNLSGTDVARYKATREMSKERFGSK